jgi:hypothetical protein
VTSQSAFVGPRDLKSIQASEKCAARDCEPAGGAGLVAAFFLQHCKDSITFRIRRKFGLLACPAVTTRRCSRFREAPAVPEGQMLGLDRVSITQ